MADEQTADEQEVAAIRKGAELELQYMLGLRDMTIREMATTARWMLTSLVVLNSGAAAAALSRAPAGHLWPIGFFVAGILLGLLAGHLSNRLGTKLLEPASRFAGYWLTVIIDANRVEEMEAAYLAELGTITKGSRWSYACGLASLAAFVGGTAAFALVLAGTR